MKRPHKIALALVLVLPLAPVVLFVHVFVHPYATRGNLKTLLAGRLSSDPALASEICRTPVDSFISPSPKISELRYGEWPWADVTLQSWRPLLPRDGTMDARVSGIGVDHDQKPLTDPRIAQLRFSYHCQFVDNGVVNQFTCEVTSPPVVVRE